MPLPSLSSAAKSRSQLTRANSVSTRSERLGQPTSDEHNGSTVASSRLHKRFDSENALSEQTDSDTAKKRSFLPQRGLPKAIARPAGAAGSEASQTRREVASLDKASGSITPHQASLGDTKESRPRPRSLYQTRATQRDTTSGIDGTTYSPRPNDLNTKPPPSSAGLSRTQSLRRPGVPSQLAPTPVSRNHARTQSTGTPIGARTDIREADKAERPKSLLAAPVYAGASSKVSAEAATGVVRTTARLDAMKRSASTRSKTALPHGRVIASTSNESGDRSYPNEGREALKQEPKKSARPAFSTLQQHFTPRKTGKAPTSTFLHAPEPANHVLPPEIISLQNELLQLHLLHESSAWTNKQWELSARKALRTKFDEVASLNQTMQKKERYGQEQKNVLALREWNGSNPLSGLVEHIQALAGPLHELPSLLDPGGRFFQLLEAFTKWFSRVDKVWSDRDASCEQGSVLHSLEGLGAAWRGEHAAVTRKLTAFARHLDGLPPAPKGSSIVHIVSRCQSLVDGLLSELQIMQVTETEVVTREKRWVEERLRTIAQEIVDVQLETDEEAWRLY